MSVLQRVLVVGMRIGVTLFVVFATTALLAQPAESVGCLYEDSAGTLWLQHIPSRQHQQLSGDANLLLHHLNQIVAITPTANAANSGDLAVDHLRVVAESCTSVLPSHHPQFVSGRTGVVTDEASVSSTASAAENTPGFQTESGRTQREGGTSAKPVESSSGAYAPLRSEQGGESEVAADTNASAAIRAEMYPQTTLGVNQKGPPPSSVRALKENAQPESPQ